MCSCCRATDIGVPHDTRRHTSLLVSLSQEGQTITSLQKDFLYFGDNFVLRHASVSLFGHLCFQENNKLPLFSRGKKRWKKRANLVSEKSMRQTAIKVTRDRAYSALPCPHCRADCLRAMADAAASLSPGHLPVVRGHTGEQ